MNPDTDMWHLAEVRVTVKGVLGSQASYIALKGDPSIWLGNTSGLILCLDSTDKSEGGDA
ncbi:hypothetical protein [Nonomuraea zeae]|uniref:Uncharacterized protein n=1 Tax=Nonomuraea zeae TaxID=1642303 RepID=A0A5S4GME7_9ACTN|nr:hypothetical protein [Nonomuraea zeae]TMR33979.1 hypothetical protein ETD85_18360 [Nonomuraea zeae]